MSQNDIKPNYYNDLYLKKNKKNKNKKNYYHDFK